MSGADKRTGRPPAPVDFESITRLHGQGVRVRAIAAQLGITRGRVERAMTRAGLPAFPVGRPRPVHPADAATPATAETSTPAPPNGGTDE